MSPELQCVVLYIYTNQLQKGPERAFRYSTMSDNLPSRVDSGADGDPGGGDGVTKDKSKMSYSDRLKTNVRYDQNMRVTNNIMAGGKADVTVGIDFNKPDKFVFDYLSKLCVVANQSVIYSKIETGAWKGKYSGERK